MYQVIEVKDMNIEESLALCKQEYMEEMQKVKFMPPIDQTIEDLLVEVIHKAKSATYGKTLICDEKLVGFLAFLGPWEGFHGVEKGLNSCCNVDWQLSYYIIIDIVKDDICKKLRGDKDEKGKKGFARCHIWNTVFNYCSISWCLFHVSWTACCVRNN